MKTAFVLLLIASTSFAAELKRPENVCGLSGAIQSRIVDCAKQNTIDGVNRASFFPEDSTGYGNWSLVTLYNSNSKEGEKCDKGLKGGCFEVWRDERTQQIWSDAHTQSSSSENSGWNSFEANGFPWKFSRPYYNIDGQRVAVSSNPVMSVCADAATLQKLDPKNTYLNPDGSNGTFDQRPAKGNLTSSSYNWHLPTVGDFTAAVKNGLRIVHPNFAHFPRYAFGPWTATPSVDAWTRYYALSFPADDGYSCEAEGCLTLYDAKSSVLCTGNGN